MPPPPAYKRSWKNLLLNKRYQLRFTLFMVGISAVLMTGLGIWVMRVANEATTVSMARVRGEACPEIPQLVGENASRDEGAVPMKLDDGPQPAATPDSANVPARDHAEKATPTSSVDRVDVATQDARSGVVKVQRLWCALPARCHPVPADPLMIEAPGCDASVKTKLRSAEAVAALREATISIVRCEGGETYTIADAEPERHGAVQIEESTLTPALPSDFTGRIVAHWTCELRQVGALDSLERGRKLIWWVLVATGIVLSLGLAVYGIKMTHRVAGPMFKVSLYFAKMRDGRLDKVYSLRKGDELVEFYEHFKAAHAGVVNLEREDIERIRELVAAAETAGVGDHEAVAELRKALGRKEKSLE
jgi:hypothetical protein